MVRPPLPSQVREQTLRGRPEPRDREEEEEPPQKIAPSPLDTIDADVQTKDVVNIETNKEITRFDKPARFAFQNVIKDGIKIRSDVIFREDGKSYRIRNVTGEPPSIQDVRQRIASGQLRPDTGIKKSEISPQLRQEIRRGKARASREEKLLAEGKRLGVEGTQFKDIEKAISEEAKTERKLKEQAAAQVAKARATRIKTEQLSPGQTALALTAAQRENPQPNFSRFEALRSRRIAEAKQQVEEIKEEEVSIGGFTVRGEVRPFFVASEPSDTALGGTAKSLLSAGFDVDVDVPERKIIATREGRTQVIDLQSVRRGEEGVGLISETLTNVPASAKINISEFRKFRRVDLSSPFRQEKTPLFSFFGSISAAGGKTGERLGVTRKGITTVAKTSAEVVQIPIDILKSDIKKGIAFERKAGRLPEKEKKTTFGDVIDKNYNEYVKKVAKRAETPRFELTEFERKSRNLIIDTAQKIKPSEIITEAGVAFLGGSIAKSVFLKKGDSALKVLKTGGALVTAGFIGTVGVETALAPPEERPSLLAKRGIELGVSIAAFRFGFKKPLIDSDFLRDPRLDIVPTGPDFPVPPTKKFVPFRVSEVKITKSGLQRTIDVIDVTPKRTGFDVQRFPFDPATQRQLALAPGGKESFLPKSYFPKRLQELGLKKAQTKLTTFGIQKPITEPQALILRPRVLSQSGIQTTLTLKTESGRFGGFRFGNLPSDPVQSKRGIISKIFPSGKKAEISLGQSKVRQERFTDLGRSKINDPFKTKTPARQVPSTTPKIKTSPIVGIVNIFDKKSLREERGIDLPIFSPVSKTFPSIDIRLKGDTRIVQDIKVNEKQTTERKKITVGVTTGFQTFVSPVDPIIDDPVIDPDPPPPDPPPPKTPIPKLPRLPDISVGQKGKKDAYDVFVKEKGEFIKVNKEPLPKNAAFNLGSDVVDNTPSATFKKMKSKKKTDKKDDFSRRARFKYEKKSKGKYQEKNRHRIDTIGELRGITVKGYLSRRNKLRSKNFI